MSTFCVVQNVVHPLAKGLNQIRSLKLCRNDDVWVHVKKWRYIGRLRIRVMKKLDEKYDISYERRKKERQTQ